MGRPAGTDIFKGVTPTTMAFTHDGHKLNVREQKFIGYYLETGNAGEAAKKSGYATPSNGKKLLEKEYIADEIRYRLSELDKETIADANEIMQYFTSVMRGEEKDQFGLDAPLSERTAAARELAKRMIDIPNKATGSDSAEVKITLDWARPDSN